MRDLIIVGVIAITSFGAAWKVQDWRYGDQIATMKADASEKTKEALRAAIAIERANQAKKDEALNEANKRAQENEQAAEQNRIAAAAAGRTADSLRKQLASARASLPQATCEAARNYAAAVSDVFADCTRKYAASAERYSELAKLAAGHASDALTLEQAWPNP